jgi:hypothetical protein
VNGAAAQQLAGDAKGNLPTGTKGNLPVDGARGNLPTTTRGGNLPVDDARGNLPTTTRGGNLPVDDVLVGSLPFGMSVHPAWALFNSRLFSEQLAASVAAALGH